MKILHLDTNHPLLLNQLNKLGFKNDEDYTSSKEEIESKNSIYMTALLLEAVFLLIKHF